ncbi:hypothetical protein [Butyrivibrio sp. MC2013]|uniref:hypothetical protein n=1 Tax=Butyrivibrio sp. MC2013 TaxID=1280686 RepID=UPI000416BDBD|nr:hypothetical protein [Butyrivibrio sp. MC2013]
MTENLPSSALAGVQIASKKDGSLYYRSSITIKGRHISLGSYNSENDAHAAYLEGKGIISAAAWTLDKWKEDYILPFNKCVQLVNYRDNGVYFSTPIFLMKKYFFYYLNQNDILTFDMDDLFYYSSHTIMKRGSHLFVADYGSHISILSRYGIQAYSVAGRDFRFVNGDSSDLRYHNIEVINHYRGVRRISVRGLTRYKAVIHVRSNYIIGTYNTEEEAAIAYNKAADLLSQQNVRKNYELNYLQDMSPRDYADIYASIRVSPRIRHFNSDKKYKDKQRT